MVKFEDFEMSDPDWWLLGPSIGCVVGLLVVFCGCFGFLRLCQGKHERASLIVAERNSERISERNAAADEKDKDSSKAAAEPDEEACNAAEIESPPSPKADGSAAGDEQKTLNSMLPVDTEKYPATDNATLLTATDGDDGMLEPVIELQGAGSAKSGGCWASCCSARVAPPDAAA